MWRKFWRSFARHGGASKRTATARRILAFERLEDRSLLAALPTFTTLSVSASTVAVGQPVTLTATVAVAPPNTGTPTGGTVTFFNGSTTLGTAPLNSGTATLRVSTLPLGTDLITASYGGNSSFAASSTEIGPNSIITTVAGNGTGYNGDGIPATAAELNHPRVSRWTPPGTSSSPTANNNRIREVNHATGMITTVAGNGTAGLQRR